jgi:hypothetical protein
MSLVVVILPSHDQTPGNKYSKSLVVNGDDITTNHRGIKVYDNLIFYVLLFTINLPTTKHTQLKVSNGMSLLFQSYLEL